MEAISGNLNLSQSVPFLSTARGSELFPAFKFRVQYTPFGIYIGAGNGGCNLTTYKQISVPTDTALNSF